MSPTSSGSFEVERYIGACLITRQNQGRYKKNFFGDQQHQNHQKFFGYNANSTNNGNVDRMDSWAGGMPLFSYQQRWRRDNYNPLSRLAEHTQGAPLILSNRYNNKKKFGPNNNNNNNRGGNTREKFFDGLSANRNSVAPSDSVSVTSDESSGSNNSETCLPRIIKPRKRRKKDRKPPPHLLRPIVQDNSYSTDSASPDIVDIDSPPITSFVPYFSYLNRRKSEPAEAYADPTPNLQHSFEDLEDFDLNGNQAESTCQCRYCDPTGQIWDIDRSCYSPYLTTPTKPAAPSLLDCLSSLSLDDCKRAAPSDSRDLQVSTEIVTSLNGHRDLEIRFFSQNNNDRTKEISNLSVRN